MPTVLGSFRRTVLAPSMADVTFAKRGFPGAGAEAAPHLEAIPQSVVCGFEWGIEGRGEWELERLLSLTDPELRGFAYEGATMACTVLDVMPGRRRDRTRRLLTGPGERHIFLAYIGIGFAMARLPRALWGKVIPDLPGSAYYPAMTWLAVDGYGFDRAYFDTARWVGRQEIPAAYPWQGFPDYFPRTLDQGVGRALWFIHAARVPDVAAAVRRFAASRRADLWSGVGLAAAFAGGCGREGFDALAREAGDHRPELAQGAVFAAKARSYAGFVPWHTGAAIEAMAGMPVQGAVDLADRSAVDSDGGGPVPDYELWRRNVQAHFASTRQSTGA
ncbi:DUF1702 family protein [Actinomadura sp. NPDC047616]|uniref:DUF1702 family protein n=1 Tax=Actinomadura sp. NPDC047616 TaxID=3155914 RepID=UPI00340E68CD